MTALSAIAIAFLVAGSPSPFSGGGLHMHAAPFRAEVTVAAGVATTLCVLFWSWVAWRLVRWGLARRDVSYYRR